MPVLYSSFLDLDLDLDLDLQIDSDVWVRLSELATVKVAAILHYSNERNDPRIYDAN
jgi:hypothetical protein